MHATAAVKALVRAPSSLGNDESIHNVHTHREESVRSSPILRSLLQAYSWAWEHTPWFETCYLLQEYVKLFPLYKIISLDMS